MSKDKSKVREAQDLLSTINNLSNSIKAYGGIMGGLHNPKLIGRKKAMENKIKNNSDGLSYWSDLENEYKKLEPHAWAVNLLGPTPLRGNTLLQLHEAYNLQQLISNDGSEEEIITSKEKLADMADQVDVAKDKSMLKLLLEEVKSELYPGDNTLQRLLNGKRDAQKATKKDKKIKKSKDPLVSAASVLIARYQEASTAFSSTNPLRKG